MMPVQEIAPGKFRWGKHGKVYRSRAAAEKQARAIYASGWREDARSRAVAHKHLSASRRAESRYVLDLLRIMGRVHAGVLHVVHREHLGTPAPDAEHRHDAHDLPHGALAVPTVRQSEPYACGPAAALALLRYWGAASDDEQQEDLHGPLDCTPKDGTEPDAIADLLRARGLSARLVTGSRLEDLESELRAGRPPMVCLQAYRSGSTPWAETWNAGHYVVVMAIAAGRVFVADPGPRGYAFIPYAEFADRWHDVVGRANPKRTQGIAIFAQGSSPPARTSLVGVSAERLDADPPRIGLGDDLLRKMFRFVRPQVQLAFDFMAKEVDDKSAAGTRLVGIRPRMVPGLAGVIDKARQKNVELITNASQDFLDQVRDVLEDHEGERHEDIAAALQERVDVSKSRAQLIARDQTLKLNGALTAHRQMAAGVTRFRWSTSHDERVRPSHRAVDGQAFSWTDGADLDDEDEPTFPGQPVNCRCVAIPIIEELEAPEEGELSPAEESEELGQAAE